MQISTSRCCCHHSSSSRAHSSAPAKAHRLHAAAQLLAIIKAGLSQGLIKTDVLGSALGQLVHLPLALLIVQLVLEVLQALDDTGIKALNGVHAVLEAQDIQMSVSG